MGKRAASPLVHAFPRAAQVWEIKNDGLMSRTRNRPLPTGRITPEHALAWGAGSGAAGTAVLLAGCNELTAGLGLFNIGLYSLVYTPMKTRSHLNTWAGSVVGAIPPVMGWTAATGSLMALEPALLGGLLYYWQFPHFFALAWRARKDYAVGGYQMVPVLDKTGEWTAKLIQRNIGYIAALPMLSSYAGLTSWMFAVEAAAINSYWFYLACQFRKKPNNAHATKVFRASLWYLPLMMALMCYHSRNWADNKLEDADGDGLGSSLVAAAQAGGDGEGEGLRQGDGIIDDRIQQLRKVGVAMCPHQMMLGDAENLPAATEYCPHEIAGAAKHLQAAHAKAQQKTASQ